jgi:hypothetical protein
MELLGRIGAELATRTSPSGCVPRLHVHPVLALDVVELAAFRGRVAETRGLASASDVTTSHYSSYVQSLVLADIRDDVAAMRERLARQEVNP